MSVARLAEAVGQDKGQISRALAELVARKLIVKSANPKDSREVLVSLTPAGLSAHDAIIEGGQERNRMLLEQLSKDELETLLRRSIVSPQLPKRCSKPRRFRADRPEIFGHVGALLRDSLRALLRAFQLGISRALP